MAKVQVPAHWVAANYLPPICARHGGPATRLVQRKLFTRVPAWAYLLILTGFLIFAIVVLTLRTTVRTALPACAECSRDRRQFIALAIAAWIAALAINVVGVTFNSDAIFVLGFLAIIAALLFTFAGDYFRVAGTVSQDLAWVTLNRVDETFAAVVSNAVRPAAPVLAPSGSPGPPATYQGTPNILPGQ